MVEEVCKVAMLLVVVEVRHPIEVPESLDELARPAVAVAGKGMSRDQQVGIAGRLCDVEDFLRPLQRLRHAPLRLHVGRQSREDEHQRIVAPKRLRQGKGRMQAGPEVWGGPTFEPQPRCSKEAAQLQFAGVSLR